jgi:phosphopantothenoylcysteine decarboxylase/phosphopantothenate--cysteine ligase
MNVNMWQHEATHKNIETLRARGVRIVEPGEGYLACGMTGPGRLAEPEAIVAAFWEILEGTRDLAGETVLVTAGPTREPIDPVRYMGNRSSGRMGYALAEAALHRGARVILISGPVALNAPAGAEVVAVETAEQMRRAVLDHVEHATILIKAAAVADFRPKSAASQKIKRSGPVTLELEPTVDILAEASARRNGSRIIIGFAAETEDTLENARKKLTAKNLDAIVVNDVSQPGIGFDSNRNAVTIISNDSVEEVGETSKREVAERVLNFAVKLRRSQKNLASAGARR